MGLFVECGVVKLVQKIWRTCESGKLLKQNKDLPLHVEASINVGYYLDCPCRYLLRVFSYEIMFKHFLYNVVILFYCKNIWKREWYLSYILFNTTMENHVLGFFLCRYSEQYHIFSDYYHGRVRRNDDSKFLDAYTLSLVGVRFRFKMKG